MSRAHAGQVQPLPPMAYEVRDCFAHHNHMAELDGAAERCAAQWQLEPRRAERQPWCSGWRRRTAYVSSHPRAPDAPVLTGGPPPVRPGCRGALPVRACWAGPAQLPDGHATGLPGDGPILSSLAQDARLSSQQTRQLARLAWPTTLPVRCSCPTRRSCRPPGRGATTSNAWACSGVGFGRCATACRCCSARRRSVPFIFIQVNRAGNISKRQSATHFHFSRVGAPAPCGTCTRPLPSQGRIVTCGACMPTGAPTCGWRTVAQRRLGRQANCVCRGAECDIQHAPRWVYAQEKLNPDRPAAATCHRHGLPRCARRTDCPQRLPMGGGMIGAAARWRLTRWCRPGGNPAPLALGMLLLQWLLALVYQAFDAVLPKIRHAAMKPRSSRRPAQAAAPKGRSDAGTPNQRASVQAYCSAARAGSRRPWPTSSGPLLAGRGGPHKTASCHRHPAQSARH